MKFVQRGLQETNQSIKFWKPLLCRPWKPFCEKETCKSFSLSYSLLKLNVDSIDAECVQVAWAFTYFFIKKLPRHPNREFHPRLYKFYRPRWVTEIHWPSPWKIFRSRQSNKRTFFKMLLAEMEALQMWYKLSCTDPWI